MALTNVKALVSKPRSQDFSILLETLGIGNEGPLVRLAGSPVAWGGGHGDGSCRIKPMCGERCKQGKPKQIDATFDTED